MSEHVEPANEQGSQHELCQAEEGGHVRVGGAEDDGEGGVRGEDGGQGVGQEYVEDAVADDAVEPGDALAQGQAGQQVLLQVEGGLVDGRRRVDLVVVAADHVDGALHYGACVHNWGNNNNDNKECNDSM